MISPLILKFECPPTKPFPSPSLNYEVCVQLFSHLYPKDVSLFAFLLVVLKYLSLSLINKTCFTFNQPLTPLVYTFLNVLFFYITVSLNSLYPCFRFPKLSSLPKLTMNSYSSNYTGMILHSKPQAWSPTLQLSFSSSH